MEPSTGPIADEMRRAHVNLMRGLRDLRAAVRSQSSESLLGVRSRLGAVREQVAEHFRMEEQGGYMDVVRQRQPRLERAAEHLAAEHEELLHALDELIRTAGQATSLTPSLGDAIEAWAEGIRGHEDRENQLIEDAFDLDLGPGD